MKMKKFILAVLMTLMIVSSAIAWNPILPPSVPPNMPAKWSPLPNQKISFNSADNTVVQSKVYSYCKDPDNPEQITVTSQHTHYNLAISGQDLVIRNLEQYYTGTENVQLTCNGISTSFGLTIYRDSNWAPFADAGEDMTVSKNVQVTFDGSDSYDLDGSIASYLWNFGDGTSASGMIVTHTFTQTGEYEVSLTVQDNQGAQDSDFIDVKVVEEKTTSGYKDSKSERTIFSRIRYNDFAQAGDILEFNVGVLNDGTYNMDNVKVTVHVMDLGARRNAGPFDIDDNQEETSNLHLEIPTDTVPGEYDVKIVASNDNFRHIEYRTLTIV